MYILKNINLLFKEGSDKISKQVTLLRVFVASPEDVKKERESVTKIINEMNPIWEKEGIQLKEVRWEIDGSPGVDEDPQNVINKQIGDDYDIFIGIMWKRFGIPTGRAVSGTEEEFNRAYGRYQEEPKNLQIMIYFNNAQPDLDEIDTKQLDLVREFKSKLGEKGVLYWDYNGIDNFEKFLRIHLTKKIHEWEKSWGNGSGTFETIEDTQEVDETKDLNNFDDEEEYGLIDLIEIGTDNFGTSTQSLARITNAIETVGKNIAEKAEEFEQSQNPTPNMKHGKRILNGIAKEMEQFVERVKPEIPIFSDSFSIGMDAFTGAAALTIDFQTGTEDPILDALTAVKGIKTNILPALGAVHVLRDTINNVPRVSRDINMAKKHMVTILNELIKEIESSKDLTSEAEKTLENAWINSQKLDTSTSNPSERLKQ